MYDRSMDDFIGYKKLIIWQKSDELALEVYKNTKNFPKNEIFSLTSQLRRAALSVPTNIVEGYARNNPAEFRQFLKIALGSLAETMYLLSVAFRLSYLTTLQYNKSNNKAEEIGRMLWKFYQSVAKKVR